ncbi:MAG: anthranilate phosphoribosyltransferase [Acidobacteria bacterium]|nr:MAG: anthranilate phosphoribosyltransferase [Acidobacteriota bacterium]
MMHGLLKYQAEEFRRGFDLRTKDAAQFLDNLIEATDEPVIRDIFIAWNEKGIAEDEIFELARIMRDRCVRVETSRTKFIDIVGTGGSKQKTFNVSTAAAFVVAGAGVAVAKHGNKAATSNSGSADVLSELGIEPAVDATIAARCLDEIGICFMFAPNFHRLSPTLAKVRRGLGFPTIFNCIGPLCNPASAPHSLIGVWDAELVSKMANALSRLGANRSWIVHGRDGLDEISHRGSTLVNEIGDGEIREFEIRSSGSNGRPIRRIESPAESADLIRGVLNGSLVDSSEEALVIENAAAAIYITGEANDIESAREIALESVRNGNAARKLSELAAAVK